MSDVFGVEFGLRGFYSSCTSANVVPAVSPVCGELEGYRRVDIIG